MFTLLKWSLFQSSSAVDNASLPPSSSDSVLGTTFWETSKNLPVKQGSPDTSTVSISGKFWPLSSSLHAACLYSSWIVCPHFHLPCFLFLFGLSQKFPLQPGYPPAALHLLIFLWIGMDHSLALRGCLGRPAGSPRVLCPGRLPPKKSFYTFPE